MWDNVPCVCVSCLATFSVVLVDGAVGGCLGLWRNFPASVIWVRFDANFVG